MQGMNAIYYRTEQVRMKKITAVHEVDETAGEAVVSVEGAIVTLLYDIKVGIAVGDMVITEKNPGYTVPEKCMQHLPLEGYRAQGWSNLGGR